MLARLQSFINSDVNIIPPELRSEFRREMSFTNIRRMKFIGLVVFLANVVFIIAIDILNLLNLPPTAHVLAFSLHVIMGLTGLIPVYIYQRYKLLSVQAMEPFHYYVGTMLPSLFLILPTALMYLITMNGGNPVGSYSFVLVIWSAGLMLELNNAVRVVLMNNLVFYATIWYAATQTRINFRLEDFFTTELLTIGIVLGMTLNFRNNAQEFVQRKQIEHDRDRIAKLNEEIAAAYEEAEVLNTSLTQALQALEHEQRTSERLLLNVLPESIAQRMKSGETTIAERFESVTVLFADIVGFTSLSAIMPPEELVSLLDKMFSAFDALAEQHGVEKIKTIGDAYMAVSGVPQFANKHTERILRFALDMLRIVQAVNQEQHYGLHVRIGVHTGEVVAGVIGKHKFSYDLWGDTVNTASRMESHGEAGKIHVSEEVYEALKEKFAFEERGEIEVKGKGVMKTYYLTGISA